MVADKLVLGMRRFEIRRPGRRQPDPGLQLGVGPTLSTGAGQGKPAAWQMRTKNPAGGAKRLTYRTFLRFSTQTVDKFVYRVAEHGGMRWPAAALFPLMIF